MTKDEALKLALEALEEPREHMVKHRRLEAITAIKAALEAKDEPVKITHKHEWFRTGEMKVGQMRCISCGIWGQEEMPQRTWVNLTLTEIEFLFIQNTTPKSTAIDFARAIEAKLKEKNT